MIHASSKQRHCGGDRAAAARRGHRCAACEFWGHPFTAECIVHHCAPLGSWSSSMPMEPHGSLEVASSPMLSMGAKPTALVAPPCPQQYRVTPQSSLLAYLADYFIIRQRATHQADDARWIMWLCSARVIKHHYITPSAYKLPGCGVCRSRIVPRGSFLCSPHIAHTPVSLHLWQHKAIRRACAQRAPLESLYTAFFVYRKALPRQEPRPG